MKEEKGITLISLAIIIIVVLIITGITFTMGLGDNGIVEKTKKSTKASFDADVADALMILQTSYTSKKEYIYYLKGNEYLTTEENKVQITKLLGISESDYGMGSNGKDIYVLTDDMKLKYYNKEGIQEELIDLGLTMEE